MKNILNSILLLLTALTGFSQSAKVEKTSAPGVFKLGIIEELQSAILGETRILNIYLPEGYRAEDTTRYPVIYLLDGSADEDFIHIAGLVQFNSFEWVNRVPKSIVVGIATVDRRRDFTSPSKVEDEKKMYPSSGKSANFIQFLEKELKPFVAKKFNTAKQSTLIGQSLGGLLLTEILFSKPALFSSYIIVSPSLWWNDGAMLDISLSEIVKSKEQPINIYIAVGKEGLAPTKKPRVMEVDANLLVEKLQKIAKTNWRIHFDYLPDENHGTILHQAVNNAFIRFSSDRFLPGSKSE